MMKKMIERFSGNGRGEDNATTLIIYLWPLDDLYIIHFKIQNRILLIILYSMRNIVSHIGKITFQEGNI